MKVAMKLNASYLFAALVVAIIGLWFLINAKSDGPDIYADIEARDAQVETVKPTVVTRRVRSELHTIRLATYGRTEPNRMVEIKAKTPGSIIATPIAEGAFVKRGTIICRQDTDARQAMVDQAKAQLDKAEADLQATEVLVEKGYRSPTQLKGERAAVNSARAGSLSSTQSA